MKILQLVTRRQYRGAEVFAANLSSELIGFGHEIIFAGLYKNDTDILSVEGAKNIDLVNNKSGVLSVNLIYSIVQLIKSENPDVVQCNGSDTLKYIIAASFFTKNIPITYRNISTISEWIDSPFKLSIYKFLFKRVAHVTSVGSESIEDLIKTFNYPRIQTSVIRRGIPIKTVSPLNPDDTLRKKFNLKDNDKIVMHVGNFSPEKNHEFLLDIFGVLKTSHPNIKLILVGTGITYKKVICKIQEMDLMNTVFPLGFRKDIPELLFQANCFALVSKIEGVPGVILEAASQKVPSVATNVGGVQEVLINGKTGFIIDNFDKKDYSEKLTRLVNNPLLNQEMGENAYRLVLQEFNPVKNARRFENLYSHLSGKSGRKNKKLRILQIIQKKQFRGAEVFASQLSTHLQNSGHVVKVVSIYEGEARLPFSGEIESLKRTKLRRTFDLYGWRKLSAIIQSFQPDIVQANASDTLKYAVMSKHIFRWKVPLIYRNASTPSFYMKTVLTRNINAFLLKNVDLVISVSKASLTDLNSLFSFTKNKSIVIPVGIEEKPKIDRTISNSPFKNKEIFNLIHIGSFTKEKNHIGLLRIFKKILCQDRNVHLNLVGGGPMLPNIKNTVDRMGIKNNIDFWGDIEDPQIYLSHADALLLPSKIEGLPGVILEAMYNQTPVIAYNVGGVSEIIENNITGKLVSFGDEDSFSNAVREIKNNPYLTNLMVKNALKKVSENYKNTDIKELFLKSYREII
ncbi:glycosyltransferase family 4 protein [Salegentibacter sp. UBA1130]|uniref:glycosyltransferase family 4 protein n=1 Tax=Salegentibacter sp. UBA1130 TaxID=1947451 RepID=UPI0025810FA8|nr:glycosyltransferase family 4 protein [Salegentibacter sp. UBA1130]